MPRLSPPALVWSEAQHCYELKVHGRLTQYFQRGDELAWRRWLDEQSAFAFVGEAGGRLSVRKEARSRGAGYWYAYRTTGQQTHKQMHKQTRKRYLGPTIKMTFDRLETVVRLFQSGSLLARVGATRTSPVQDMPPDSHVGAGRAETGGATQTQGEYELPSRSLKLSRPRLPAALVERTRLLSDLEAVRSHPLTLISASAGSGKTTLLSAWVALSLDSQQGQETTGETTGGAKHAGSHSRFAWLSLDELDNDPVRFWTAVIAALRTCAPQCGRRALRMLWSPASSPLSTILTTLLEDLDEDLDQTLDDENTAIILILDDYHVISDQTITESMRYLLDRLDHAHLRLVLATRTDPELPLARWRVRSGLVELRDRDLRFTEGEAARFLTAGMGLPLTAEEVGTLHQRTEGWIAGLQVAALSLQKHAERADRVAFLQAFTGSQRYLLDYVQEDILARLPTSVYDFLLHIAILSRVDAAACQAVTAEATTETCQRMLLYLERHNLFLVPLDEERRWYRLHDLFREALLAALQTVQPELAPVLHRRAAAFYEAHGEWSEAIAHRLAAADFDAAAHLMEQSVERFWLQGEAATVVRWVLSLPTRQVRAYARLALTAALYLFNTITYATAEQRASTSTTVRRLMARVEAALGPQLSWPQRDDTSPDASPDARRQDAGWQQGVDEGVDEREAQAPEDALLRRRLRLLHLSLAFTEVTSRGEHERLLHMEPAIAELQNELDHDAQEEAIWRLVPLSYTFVLSYTVRDCSGGHPVERRITAQECILNSLFAGRQR